MRRFAFLLLGLFALRAIAPATAAFAANSHRYRVAGTVTDTLGRPLSDANVVLQTHSGHTAAHSRTNSTGHFAFRGIPPGTYAAVATKPGFTTAVAILTVTGAGAKPVAIAMQSQVALSLKVTAKRITEAPNALSPRTGGSVYRFNQKAIQAMPQGGNTQMSSVLLQAPGVVQDSYGQLHIRGEHGDIQYRINGIELPEGISSGFSETFSPRFAQSVSLLVGALPAQYGYHTAGVVNIRTKSGDSFDGGDLDMYGGQRGTLQPSFELGGEKGKLSYYASGSYIQNDRGLAPPTAGPVAIHDTTYQGDGFSYLSYLLNPVTRLSFIGGFNVSHYEIPNNPDQPPEFTLEGVTSYPSAELNENQLEQNYYGVLALQGVVADHLDYQVAGFSRYSTLSFYPDNVGDLIYNGVASRIFRGDWANGLQGDFAWRGFAHHTIRAGFYFQGERAEIDNHSLVFPGGSGFQTSFVPEPVVDDTALVEWLYGIYIEDEWKPLPKLTINYGVRFDLYDGLTRSDQASPRVGAVYHLFEGTALHAAYARYFTPPPLEAVSGEDIRKFSGTTNQPAVLADSNISPERAHYFDAGVTQNLPYNVKVGLDSYYKKSTDLLDEGQFGPTLIFTPFNYNKGRQYGVEFTTSFSRDNLSAYTNFAYSVAQGNNIVSDQFLFDPAELEYIKNHYVFLDHDQTFTASWGTTYQWRGFMFSLDGLYGSGLRTGFANTGNLPFYIQFNAAIAKKVAVPGAGRVEGRIAVVNLGDWIYQIRSGSGIGVFAPQYGPRRAVYAGIRWYFPWSKPGSVTQ